MKKPIPVFSISSPITGQYHAVIHAGMREKYGRVYMHSNGYDPNGRVVCGGEPLFVVKQLRKMRG